MHTADGGRSPKKYRTVGRVLKSIVVVGIAVALYSLHQNLTLSTAGYTLTTPLYIVWSLSVVFYLVFLCIRGIIRRIGSIGERMQLWREQRRTRHIKNSLSHALTHLTTGDFEAAESELFSSLSEYIKPELSKDSRQHMSSFDVMWSFLAALCANACHHTSRAHTVFTHFLNDPQLKTLGILGLYRTKFYELSHAANDDHAPHAFFTFFMGQSDHDEALNTIDLSNLKELASVLEQGLYASKKYNAYATEDEKLLNATHAHPWIVKNLLNIYSAILEKSAHGTHNFYERADILKRVAYDRRIITKAERNRLSARMIWSKSNQFLHDRHEDKDLSEQDIQSISEFAFDSYNTSESLDGPVIFLHTYKPSSKTYKMLLNVMETHPTQNLLDAIIHATPATAEGFAVVEKKLIECKHPLTQRLLAKLAHKAQLWGRAKQIEGHQPIDTLPETLYKKAS